MGVEVIVRCDAPDCDATAPAYDFDVDPGGGWPASHSMYVPAGGPPRGWIDGSWQAPDGWTLADDGRPRCPKHSE